MSYKELSKEEAITIANNELKKSYYNSQLKIGWVYSWLDFELDCNETMYNGEEVYYIRVIGGNFGAKRDDNYKQENLGLFSELKNIDGTFDENNNIKCVIFKKDGKYEYLGE